MRRSVPAYFIGLILFSAAFLSGGEVSAYNGWGETLGPVYATVRGTDGPGGLSVRSAPDERSPILGRLALGTAIRAYNQFHHGWVQVRTPVQGGWVRIDQLEPQGGEAVVSGIDRPEGCLRIRNGPSTSTQVVGCAGLGDTLLLTGIWSEGPWAQVARPIQGWVYTPQIQSSLNPPGTPTRAVYARQPVRTVVSTPVRYYATTPSPSHLYVRPWKNPYRKYRRHFRRARAHSSWNYPSRRNAYVGRSNRNTARGYGNRNWALRVGPRGGVGVRAGRVGFGVGPRGGFYVRGRR